MRFKLSELEQASVIARGSRPEPTAERGRRQREQVVELLAIHGHLRTDDIAAALWPTAKFGKQLASRQLRRLTDEGLVMPRVNSVATTSFVLTRRGAVLAEALGRDAKHGLDLSSVAGATFIHRSLGARFGIEMTKQGAEFYGEHALLTGQAPWSPKQLSAAFGRMPDFLVRLKGSVGFWFGEVEVAPKSTAELRRCFDVALDRRAERRDPRLAGVMFVCDSRLNHPKRLSNVASGIIREEGPGARALLLDRVRVVSVSVTGRYRWAGMSRAELGV